MLRRFRNEKRKFKAVADFCLDIGIYSFGFACLGDYKSFIVISS